MGSQEASTSEEMGKGQATQEASTRFVLLTAAEGEDGSLTPRGTQVHKISEKGSERQLLLRVRAQHHEGEAFDLQVLIDTGAEANLIRRDLVPHLLSQSPRPLALLTANGARMVGGNKEVALDLLFGARAYTTGAKLPDRGVQASFHDADIQVDAILSFPWLRANRLGVWAHQHALELQGRPRILLDNFEEEVPSGDEQGTEEETDVEDSEDEEISEEEADRRWAQVAEVRAMGLGLPTEAGEYGEEILFNDEETLWLIAKKIREAAGEGITPAAIAQATKIQGVVLVPEGAEEEDPEITRRSAAIHKDFNGKVLRDALFPGEQPIRGPLGEGKIELKPGAVAKKQRAILLTGPRREAMLALVDDWEKNGKVEPGYSEWSSPAFVVAKKGGKWRGVVDFRALNEATVGDSHPLPRIEDILVRQGRKTLFSVMDLKDAFHQVPLQKESRPCTCCSTPRGTKQWCVVVMGLKNGVAIFQRVIEYCLRNVADVADPYVDDIIIGTEGTLTPELIEQHDKDIRRVLEALGKEKMVADDRKCKWFVRKVEFCGHILGEGKRTPAPGKLTALELWEEPRTVTALRGFLGFTNYYSAYIQNYAELAADLMEKLKVGKVAGKKAAGSEWISGRRRRQHSRPSRQAS